MMGLAAIAAAPVASLALDPPVASADLAATVSSTTSIAGALDVVKGLTSAVATSTAIAADLSSPVQLVASVETDTGVAGSLDVVKPLDAAITTSTSIAGALDITKPLASSLTTSTAIAGALRVPQFLLYHNASVIARISGSLRQQELAGLGLPVGDQPLELTRVDIYDNESVAANITVRVSVLGTPGGALTRPSQIRVLPEAGGYLRVEWRAIKEQGDVDPAEWDVADGTSYPLSLTILEIVPFTGRIYAVSVGPFSHGASKIIAIRARTGAASGDFVFADAATADAQAPPVPELA